MDLTADFETTNTGGIDLTVVGSTVYSQHPLTEVEFLTITGPGLPPQTWTPADGWDDLSLLAELILDQRVIWWAHSAGFEKDIWRNIMVARYGFPDIPNERWRDTQASCAWRAVPLSLEGSLEALECVNRKDIEGSNLIKSLSKPNKKGEYDFSPEKLSRGAAYNRSDVLGQEELRQRIGPLSPSELRIWQLDQTINERGVKVDLPYVRACLKVTERAAVPLLREFDKLTGLRPTQGQKFLLWLRERDVLLPNLRKETVAAVIGPEDAPLEWSSISELEPEAHRALRIRQLVNHTSITKLQWMLQCAAYDGALYRLLQYHGAGPGRWAGRNVQVQNFPRGTLKGFGKDGKYPPEPEFLKSAIMSGDPDFVEDIIGAPAIEAVASGLRHALIARPGRVFNSGDYAAIECRMALALAGQHDKLGLLASGADVHSDMASKIFKRPIDAKKDPIQRQIGKNGVYGCCFQVGGDTFCRQFMPECQCRGSVGPCQQDPMPECRITSGETVQVYRKEWAPEVPKVWRDFNEVSLRAVLTPGAAYEAYGVVFQMEGDWLGVQLPSGGKLWYYKPTVRQKKMPWTDRYGDPVWKPTWRFLSWAGESGKCHVTDAYGGLITQNVIEALCRQLLVDAMFRCEANNFPIVFTVTDEITAEPEQGADLKAFTQMMEEREDWAKALKVPIKVEPWEGPCYRK